MIEQICVEHASVGPGKSEVVVLDGNGRVSFPNVDSCIAIIFLKYTDKRAVCGHAGMWDESINDLNMPGQLLAMLNMMNAADRGAIDKVVFIGHLQPGNGGWDVNGALAATPFLASVAHVTEHHDNAIDITFDLGSYRLVVTDKKTGATNSSVLHVAPRTSCGPCCVIM